MKKKLYQLHSIISLVIAIPVILWAASGFMHPIMTTIRPQVKATSLATVPIDYSRIKLNPKDALTINKIDSFHDVRLIHIDTNWFYQVQHDLATAPVYLSCVDGKMLANGDELYARYLARQFLDGQEKYLNNPVLPTASLPLHDCCESAKKAIFNHKSGSPVQHVESVKSFDAEYGEVNKILPVYKVSFQRKDGIRIYVETIQDRFVYAVDDKRASFDTIFSIFHTWDWADSLGNMKLYVMAILLSLTMMTALFGIYLFFTTKHIKPNGNRRLNPRYNHRWVSITASLFTLMFSFSGAFHAIEKTEPDSRYDYYNNQMIETAQLQFAVNHVFNNSATKMSNLSVVKIHDSIYWRFIRQEEPMKKTSGSKPQWSKDKKTTMPVTFYFQDVNGQDFPDGEMKYAQYLADHFRGTEDGQSINTKPITFFEGEYGFVNKRLPVWKIEYSTNDNERYYVETTTGKLAVRIDDNDLAEGYSFSFLHKHHFMDFAGKPARDFSTMFWAAMQIVMVSVGLYYYFSKRNK